MVEIDEDSRDYGSGDQAGAVGGGDGEESKVMRKTEDDNVSVTNINIEKAEVGAPLIIIIFFVTKYLILSAKYL